MKKYILSIALVALTCTNIQSFKSLNDIRTYAHTIEELPASDNSDWLDPDYTSFHKNIEPGWLTHFLAYFGISLKKVWSEFAFETLLKEVIEQRDSLNLVGRKVALLRYKNKARVFVWSDMHGAFHSLVRCLSYLEKENIIDKNLKILASDDYFVFNGDFIDRSPFSLESLHVILLLLKNNPEKVFYIRGKHEDKNHWHNYGLKRELVQRLHLIENGDIPLGSFITDFFNTLPLAFYLSSTDEPSNLIRISHSNRSNKEINEQLMGDFFSAQRDPGVYHYDITKKKKSDKKPVIHAIVHTENWRKEHKTNLGLGLLGYDYGTTAWAILSAPIEVYQKFYNFFYDAFGVIDATIPIKDSTISLYHQNIKTKSGFKKKNTFNITSGQKVIENQPKQKQKKDIVIGSSMSLIRGVPAMGQRIKRGMSVRLQEENQRGGINGHILKTIIYNDDYTPSITRTNVNRLIDEHNIDLLLLPVGSPTLASYLDYIRNKKVTVFFPITGGPQFRAPDLHGLGNFRGTYSDEAYALVEFLIKKYNARKFAFFYQDDGYGKGPLEAAHQVLKKNNIEKWLDVPYTRGTVNLTKQADAIKTAQPDAIGLFSTAQTTQELIRQVGVENLTNSKLFGISFLGEESFRQFIKKYGLNVLFGSVVPNPQVSSLEIVRDYRKAMDKNHYPYDIFSLEGYIATSILLELMSNIQGPITNEALMKELEALNNYPFKGLTLTFDPQTRSIAQYVWLESGDNEKWEKKEIKDSYSE